MDDALNKKGVKDDKVKTRPSLVIGSCALAMQRMSDVGTFGASKYTDNGWMTVEDGFKRYTDAMLRHFLAESEGVEFDDETGIEHAAHTAWNAVVRLELMLRSKRKEEKKENK